MSNWIKKWFNSSNQITLGLVKHNKSHCYYLKSRKCRTKNVAQVSPKVVRTLIAAQNFLKENSRSFKVAQKAFVKYFMKDFVKDFVKCLLDYQHNYDCLIIIMIKDCIQLFCEKLATCLLL